MGGFGRTRFMWHIRTICVCKFHHRNRRVPSPRSFHNHTPPQPRAPLLDEFRARVLLLPTGLACAKQNVPSTVAQPSPAESEPSPRRPPSRPLPCCRASRVSMRTCPACGAAPPRATVTTRGAQDGGGSSSCSNTVGIRRAHDAVVIRRAQDAVVIRRAPRQWGFVVLQDGGDSS